MKSLMILSKEFITDPRVNKEATSLIKKGHQVCVLFWNRMHNKNLVTKNINVTKVFEVFCEKSPNILLPDLIRNPIWWRVAYKKALKIYKNEYKFDVVHCHDLDTLQIGVWLKRKLDIKLIYDSHEIFGYMIERTMPNFIVNIAFCLEKQLLKHVDHIITVNEPLLRYFKNISNKPITIVMNCIELFTKEYISPHNNVFSLCYIGVLHKSRMFPEIIDAIGNIPDVKLIIAGKKENLYETVKNRCKKYKNIEFLGSIPFNEVISITLASNAVIHMVNPLDRNNRIGLANKQFEAMVCGRPIIITKDTYAGDFAKKNNCGVIVDYSTSSLKIGILKLKNSPALCERLGRNALKAAIDTYNWQNQENKLANVYSDLGSY
jgi:glycosyltransferase involved in cell wall biosynthesis